MATRNKQDADPPVAPAIEDAADSGQPGSLRDAKVPDEKASESTIAQVQELDS